MLLFTFHFQTHTQPPPVTAGGKENEPKVEASHRWWRTQFSTVVATLKASSNSQNNDEEQSVPTGLQSRSNPYTDGCDRCHFSGLYVTVWASYRLFLRCDAESTTYIKWCYYVIPSFIQTQSTRVIKQDTRLKVHRTYVDSYLKYGPVFPHSLRLKLSPLMEKLSSKFRITQLFYPPKTVILSFA